MKTSTLLFKTVLAYTFSVCLTSAAMAPTSDEIMTNMSDEQRGGYLTGAVEASAFLAHASGDRARSQCIMEWFFEADTGANEIVQALDHFRDRQAQPVIMALINRACPAE